MPGAGGIVPDMELALDNGTTTRLSSYRGRWLVLYFYPKDNTPGCTREGQEFGDRHAQFERLGAQVLGVSRDSVKSHSGFCAKHGFPFHLVSDADEALCNAFGVIKDKNMYGRKVRGVERSTFLIDPEGRIREQWRGVKVPGHVDAVLDALTALQA